MGDENGTAPSRHVRDLQRLLDRLVPPSAGRVEDIAGRGYDVPRALPARRQVAVARVVRAIVEEGGEGVAAAARDVGRAATAGDAGGAVDAFLRLACDDRVVDRLDEAFAVAFPDVLDAARRAAGRDGAPASDLFALDQIGLAFLPFSAATVASVTRLLAHVAVAAGTEPGA